MKIFIAFVVFKLLVDDVILALVIYAQRKQSKINQQTLELSMRNQTEIKSIDNQMRLEKLYRERKRMYNPCNYGGHDFAKVSERVIKTIGGESKHYYDFVCRRCGKNKTTTKPVISRWEEEE